jgi:hypothetical protein
MSASQSPMRLFAATTEVAAVMRGLGGLQEYRRIETAPTVRGSAGRVQFTSDNCVSRNQNAWGAGSACLPASMVKMLCGDEPDMHHSEPARRRRAGIPTASRGATDPSTARGRRRPHACPQCRRAGLGGRHGATRLAGRWLVRAAGAGRRCCMALADCSRAVGWAGLCKPALPFVLADSSLAGDRPHPAALRTSRRTWKRTRKSFSAWAASYSCPEAIR